MESGGLQKSLWGSVLKYWVWGEEQCQTLNVGLNVQLNVRIMCWCNVDLLACKRCDRCDLGCMVPMGGGYYSKQLTASSRQKKQHATSIAQHTPNLRLTSESYHCRCSDTSSAPAINSTWPCIYCIIPSSLSSYVNNSTNVKPSTLYTKSFANNVMDINTGKSTKSNTLIQHHKNNKCHLKFAK
jgi:hypothetical protein